MNGQSCQSIDVNFKRREAVDIDVKKRVGPPLGEIRVTFLKLLCVFNNNRTKQGKPGLPDLAWESGHQLPLVFLF